MNLRESIRNWGLQVLNRFTFTTGASRFHWPWLSSGIRITEEKALELATVWACVRVIREAMSSLGWHVLRELANGNRERESGSLNWLLNVQANPEMTAFVWRELAVSQVLLCGNHYSEIQRDAVGRPLWLWPLDPQAVTVERDDAGNLRYRVSGTNGPVYIQPEDMLHFKGLGFDGLVGYSVISVAAMSLGYTYQMDEYGAAFYANGTHLGLVFEHPGKLSPEAKKNIVSGVEERHQGGRKSFRAMVAEEGMKLQRATMSQTDAQFFQSRKNQNLEICRWFGVPPHKVGDLERATFSNIEHQSIEFVQDTILPWCKRFEQEVDVKLIGMRRQGQVYTRLNIDSLLRGDMESRYRAYAIGRQWGWLNVNKILTMEHQNTIGPQGDTYLTPSNMIDADSPAQLPTPNEPNKGTQVDEENTKDTKAAKVAYLMQERMKRHG